MSMSKSESKISDEIILMSNGRDMNFYNQEVGTFITQRGTYITIGKEGMPDIFGDYMGRMVWIETKSKAGKLKFKQSEFICGCIQRGVMAFCARSKEHVLNMLHGHKDWQWQEFAHVIDGGPTAFHWAKSKYLRQTGNHTVTTADFHRYQARLAGVPEKHILEIIP